MGWDVQPKWFIYLFFIFNNSHDIYQKTKYANSKSATKRRRLATQPSPGYSHCKMKKAGAERKNRTKVVG